MKKNFYAVALALATACTTFVGCKDYDSDIKNLQTQIDANKSAIEALQQAIAKGVTISGIEKKSDGYTIKFSDGSSVELTNGKDGVNGTNGMDAPVPQLRVNAAGNWEMSADGGAIWAELKDIAGNSIADAKAYVNDYVKIDEGGYIVIGDKTTSFKYDVTIPSVTEDVENRVAIITVPATDTEPMKTLRVPMEGYFDRLFVSNITPVSGKTTLIFTKTTMQADATLGGKEYKSGDVVYTTAGMPVVINPAQVNAGAMTFTFVANTGTTEPETMPVTLALTQGSNAAISMTKAAPATGLWTVSGTVTDDAFAGFEGVALCALNGNGTNTLSDYAFEIDVQAGAASAGAVSASVSQNDGSAAVLAAATDIIDSYASFDDGSQEKDGYIVRRADGSVPADAPYTGDWEVVPAQSPAMTTMLTKSAVPTTELTVVYTAVGMDGAKAETNVAVKFFAPIPEPAVTVYSVADEQVQDGDGSAPTEFTVTLSDLESALFPTAALQEVWENSAENLTVALDAPLADEGSNSVKFYNDTQDAGASVSAVSDFNKITFAIDNKTAAGEYTATFAYEDQAGNKTEVKISFFLASPVAAVKVPEGKEIANTSGAGQTVAIAVADFTAEDGGSSTVSGGIKSIVSATSTNPEKMTTALADGTVTCTRVAEEAPADAETVAVNVTVEDQWGVKYDLVVNVAIAAAEAIE